MLLSIISPVYNVEKYLSETVESVLCQTFRDFELVLVDDGSTDSSGALCEKLAEKDPRIVVIRKENGGVSSARNAGLAAARGKYIGFTDSDDLIEPDMYEKMVTALEETGADIVQCRHDRGTGGASYGYNDKESLTGEEFVKTLFTLRGGDYTNHVSLCSKIYKKELWEKDQFPLGRTYEDEQETYKVCLKAEKIALIPDVLYHYVKREDSIITGVSARKMLDKQAALLDRLCYLPEKLPETEKDCAKSFAVLSLSVMKKLRQAGDRDSFRAAWSAFVSERERIAGSGVTLPFYIGSRPIAWYAAGHGFSLNPFNKPEN